MLWRTQIKQLYQSWPGKSGALYLLLLVLFYFLILYYPTADLWPLRLLLAIALPPFIVLAILIYLLCICYRLYKNGAKTPS